MGTALHTVKKLERKIKDPFGGFGSPQPIKSPKVEKRKYIPVNHLITNFGMQNTINNTKTPFNQNA